MQMEDLTTALETAFVSPNECDSNMEAANVVDGLFAIARAISSLAESMKQGVPSHDEDAY